jgi:hypothetical protein
MTRAELGGRSQVLNRSHFLTQPKREIVGG